MVNLKAKWTTKRHNVDRTKMLSYYIYLEVSLQKITTSAIFGISWRPTLKVIPNISTMSIYKWQLLTVHATAWKSIRNWSSTLSDNCWTRCPLRVFPWAWLRWVCHWQETPLTAVTMAFLHRKICKHNIFLNCLLGLSCISLRNTIPEIS
jgi:hypothetical protein